LPFLIITNLNLLFFYFL
jgi:hypothetical protein